MKKKATSISAMVLVLVLLLTLALSCGKKEEPAPFSMELIPAQMEDAIAGQRCVFLVVVADEGEGSGEGEVVNISATAPGSAVTVDPQAITPGQVAEVTVIPDEASRGGTLTVTVRGERDGLEEIEVVTIDVWEGEDQLGPVAAEMRNKFIPWLAANHPEFGITDKTEWTGTIARPNIVVVMYYLFFSEDWEMGVSWHVTISPHDWTRIYLRHRTTEMSPSYAFEISSWSAAQEEPHAIDPPESVWR